jgi:PRTRC genetic system protein F
VTAMLPASVLALPALAPEVPALYTIPGAAALSVPLTIALLEAGVITDAMLRTPRNALLIEVFGETERQLSARALSHWWTKLIRETPCKFFRWSMHVQQLEDYYGHGYDKATTAWFCFTRMDGEIPRFALARGIERLELLREGFGQTVLAVLRDATLLLPDSFNPWVALSYAEYMYWGDSVDDVDLLEQRREMGEYKTVEELLNCENVITRAMFYAELPEWVCAPKRILSRDQVQAAAGGVRYARQVIDVCDELYGLVNRPNFILRPMDKGTYRSGQQSYDASMVLVWKEFDVIGQAIDDCLEDLGNSGDGCESIDTNPVPMTAAGVREFMILTEQCIQVAVLTEKLILLLGEKL